MKNKFKVVLLVMSLLVIGCAGKSKYMVKGQPLPEPSPGKALVYFMRPSSTGAGFDFQIWEGYKLLGISVTKSYFVYECDPGKHLFIGRAQNKRVVEADLDAGKSYYIIVKWGVGFYKARMGFIPVSRGSAYWDQVEKYKEKTNFLVPNEEEIAKWRVGREAEIKKEIDDITNYVKTPEGEQYIVYLRKEDGR